MHRRPVTTLLALLLVGAWVPTTAGANEMTDGRWSAPFTEPTINGTVTDERCIEGEDGLRDCKPAAGSSVMLPNGDVLYWNALEGTENADVNVAAQGGHVAEGDQTRVLRLNPLDLDASSWSKTEPEHGGGDNPLEEDGKEYELPPELIEDPEYNDNNLFCTDLVFLPDGRLLVAGGTDYYNEPGVGAPGGVGLVELEGLRLSRTYDYRTEEWTLSGAMNDGRWYPSMVTLGDGRVFVASGVTKLIKPYYSDRPTESGANVRRTETYDPNATGEFDGQHVRGVWTDNGPDAERSLPLYPRLHLLPNGDVLYSAGGQVFNPAGYAPDEALWNIAAVYDPDARAWTDLGVPGIGTLAPGFRGSTFSVQLPLVPDPDTGEYSQARFLQAGGVYGVTPGSYLPTVASNIMTVDVSDPEAPVMDTDATGTINEPRWYPSGVLLPDGTVFMTNGGSADHVVAPGTEMARRTAEIFDPATGEWRQVAAMDRDRTYHNTALLLADGSVLVGGHAPIPTMYHQHDTLPGGFAENDGRDPSFQIYYPPYFFSEARPTITSISSDTVRLGPEPFVVTTPDAAEVTSVRLVRNTATTHVIDNDQRTVVVPFTQDGGALRLEIPDNGNVLPAGPYLLFINTTEDDMDLPSEGVQVFVQH